MLNKVIALPFVRYLSVTQQRFSLLSLGYLWLAYAAGAAYFRAREEFSRTREGRKGEGASSSLLFACKK